MHKMPSEKFNHFMHQISIHNSKAKYKVEIIKIRQPQYISSDLLYNSIISIRVKYRNRYYNIVSRRIIINDDFMFECYEFLQLIELELL